MSKRIVVTGAGGFIGSHLVRRLKAEGHRVRGVDVKHSEFWPSVADEFEIRDLRRWDECALALRNTDEVYALAADMGGMGFISSHHAEILHNNSLINLHTLEAAKVMGVGRVFYSSSACIYPEYRQTDASVTALREEDAYPAAPQDAYGWEKLVTERLCLHYMQEFGIQTRVARFHNIFGPYGTWNGGREKAPAAICRKVAEAKWSGSRIVEVWGDGLATRSFCYIDDCIEGIRRIMDSNHAEPINLGSDRLISVNDLVDTVAALAGIRVEKRHVPGPQGVRGRNSDNTRLRAVLGWEPSVGLESGLSATYSWIEPQVRSALSPMSAPELR